MMYVAVTMPERSAGSVRDMNDIAHFVATGLGTSPREAVLGNQQHLCDRIIPCAG
jgi:hypothetical protein